MSDQEKFEAQGRAYAAVKTARSNVATLTVSLREFSTMLRELSAAIDAFVLDPARRDPGAIKPQYANIQDHLRRLSTERAVFELGEIQEEAAKARLLQEQIEKF